MVLNEQQRETNDFSKSIKESIEPTRKGIWNAANLSNTHNYEKTKFHGWEQNKKHIPFRNEGIRFELNYFVDLEYQPVRRIAVLIWGAMREASVYTRVKWRIQNYGLVYDLVSL